MPASWPAEALKAQSVVARSYILNNLNRHNDKAYDLCASVHCIVYAGASNENKKTTEAIIATKNEVITHNDRIIDAVFSSNSGGYTEASENVWINSLPYLKAVNTSNQNNYEFPLAPYQIEEWFIEKPESYSNNKYTTQSSYRWVKNIDLEKLKQRHNLEGINKVYVTNRTTTGTVKEIVIEGLNDSITVNNSSIRRALTGLKSNKFILKNIYDKNRLESLIIFGAGWGHSVGMDQSAAAGMAVDGKDYKTIINQFYPDTEITNLK
jgi:SpoIID/LytB domain protein